MTDQLTADHRNDLEQLRGALMIILELDSMLQAGQIEAATEHARYNAQAICEAWIKRNHVH